MVTLLGALMVGHIYVFLRHRGYAKALMGIILLIFALGAGDYVVHGPWGSLIGLRPRWPRDYHINFWGAKELYGHAAQPKEYSGSPYGIREKYQLKDHSVSFPFPTYWFYWVCSGFGRLSLEITGLVLLVLQMSCWLAALGISLRLALPPKSLQPPIRDFWLLAGMAFIILISQGWGELMVGQTSVFVAFFLTLALWLWTLDKTAADFLGASSLALASLIKPPLVLFTLALLILPLLQWARLRHGPRRPLAIFLAIWGAMLALIGVTLLAPGGVRLETYLEFHRSIAPKLLIERGLWTKNISLTSLGAFLLNLLFGHSFIRGLSLLGFALGCGVALKKRASLWAWLVLPLLFSPIVWINYATWLLPLQLVLFTRFYLHHKIQEVWLLFLSLGLLFSIKPVTVPGVPAAFGLLITFYLALKLTGPEEGLLNIVRPRRSATQE